MTFGFTNIIRQVAICLRAAEEMIQLEIQNESTGLQLDFIQAFSPFHLKAVLQV